MQPTSDQGYDGLSIALHWLTAIAVVALFMTHEGERGSAMQAFHVGGGAILGVFLLWRVWRRWARGMTGKPEQSAALNLLSQIVIWGLLASILVVVVTGYLLPWSMGRPLDIYGLAIPSPLPANRSFHEALEEIHNVAGQAFMPLVGLHVLGVIKHWLMDTGAKIAARMFVALPGGK